MSDMALIRWVGYPTHMTHLGYLDLAYVRSSYGNRPNILKSVIGNFWSMIINVILICVIYVWERSSSFTISPRI